MRLKVMHRTVQAYRTKEPGEVDRLMSEAEKLNVSEAIYNTAADIARTVQANCKEAEAAEVIAAYIVRYALILSKAGELVEAPPRPRPKKRRKLEPEGGAEA